MKKKPTKEVVTPKSDATSKTDAIPKTEEQFPGYPKYDPKDDIYNREQEVPLEDEEDLSLSEGLDVPGADLDDAEEAIGEEDEENNYYSLGGDDHNDLEEDKGE